MPVVVGHDDREGIGRGSRPGDQFVRRPDDPRRGAGKAGGGRQRRPRIR